MQIDNNRIVIISLLFYARFNSANRDFPQEQAYSVSPLFVQVNEPGKIEQEYQLHRSYDRNQQYRRILFFLTEFAVQGAKIGTTDKNRKNDTLVSLLSTTFLLAFAWPMNRGRGHRPIGWSRKAGKCGAKG
jgi:hypothetical protein